MAPKEKPSMELRTGRPPFPLGDWEEFTCPGNDKQLVEQWLEDDALEAYLKDPEHKITVCMFICRRNGVYKRAVFMREHLGLPEDTKSFDFDALVEVMEAEEPVKEMLRRKLMPKVIPNTHLYGAFIVAFKDGSKRRITPFLSNERIDLVGDEL